MICTNCGCLNDDNFNFCNQCGNPLNIEPDNAQYSETYYQETAQNQEAQYQQPQYQQTQYQQSYCQQTAKPQKDPGKVLGIVGMSLSIASFVLTDAFVLAIVGTVLSAIAKKQSREAGFNNTFAKVGFICGIINAIFTVVVLVIVLLLYFGIFAYSFDYFETLL